MIRALLLAVLVGSCTAYTLTAVPRVGARAMSLQMRGPTGSPHFGDNTFTRRDQLSTYVDGTPAEGSTREPTNTFSPVFGDNTYARREELASFTGNVVPTGSVSQSSKTFSPHFGDNTEERRRSLCIPGA